MKKNKLYLMTIADNHINIAIKALSLFLRNVELDAEDVRDAQKAKEHLTWLLNQKSVGTIEWDDEGDDE